MKKVLLTLLFGVLISVTAMAQKANKRIDRLVDKDLAKIEATVTLEDSEKEKYLELKKAYLTNHFSASDKYKESDKDILKQKIKENKDQFESEVNAAFGKERAAEILAAGSKGKKKKK